MHGMRGGGGGVTRIGPTQTWEVWDYLFENSRNDMFIYLKFDRRVNIYYENMNTVDPR